MSRTYEEVEILKLGINQQSDTTAIQGYPPGYYQGFKLTISSGQLIIGKGTCNIRGHRVDLKEDTIFDANWYVVESVTGGKTYYIYINENQDIIADVLSSVYDSESFGFYHPVLRNYRFVGKFDLDANKDYDRVVSQDPVIAGDIESALIGTTKLIIGYSGSGTLAEPAEGDRRVYIDNDEIGLEEYTGGAWSTVRGIKIGGLTGTLFLAMIGCTGIYHPESAPTNVEYFLGSNYRVFNFENNAEDQLGVDDWDTKTQVVYDNTVYKFGSYSFTTQTPFDGVLQHNNEATQGQSQSCGVYLYATGTFAAQNVIQYGSGNDSLQIQIQSDGGVFKVQFVVVKGGVQTTQFVSTVLTSAEWHYVSFSYDSSTNTFYGTYDSEKVSFTPTGSWTGGALNITLNTIHTTGGMFTYLDEAIFAPDQFVDPDFFIQHYNHNVAWNTTNAITKNDIQILPNTGGKVIIQDIIRALDASGLIIEDDGGNQVIEIEDGGALKLTIGADTDNTVLIQNASGQIKTDEIDSRVWGSSLVDYTGTSAGYIPQMVDADTITDSIISQQGGAIYITTAASITGLLVEDGFAGTTTAATPSMAFVGDGQAIGYIGYLSASDEDMTIINSQAANLELGTNGTNMIIIDSSGNVELNNNASSGQTPELKVYGYRAADALRSLQIGVGVDAADTASFDGVSNYYFDGNVGIKTYTPGGTLHVETASAGAVTPNAIAKDVIIENNTNSGVSILTPDINVGSIAFGSTSNNDNALIQGAYNGGSPYMRFLTGSTSNVRMLIDNSGNVLIGTTNAHQLLTVDGNISMYASETGNVDRYLDFASDASIFWDESPGVFDINQPVNITGHVYASLGRKVADEWDDDGSSKTQNEVYDHYSSFLPGASDDLVIVGVYEDPATNQDVIVSSIMRTSASALQIHGINITTRAIQILTCTDGNATAAIDNWHLVL